MSTNNYFDIKRLYFMIVRNLRLHLNTTLIGAGAVAGFIIMISLISILFNQIYDPSGFLGLALPLFIFGGYLLTSFSFSEAHSSAKGCFYLTLPASGLEKLISAWLVSSVGYVLFSILLFFIISVLISVISIILLKTHFILVNLFTPDALQTYGVYLVTQSIFLFGSIYFRKNNFFKTFLSLFLISMVIGVFTAAMIHLIINPRSHVWGFDSVNTPDSVKYFFMENILPVFKVLFWYLTAPFFLFMSYLRLKERQV